MNTKSKVPASLASSLAIVAAAPPSFKLDIAEPYHNHWHVKCALLKDIPATGVRLYNYYNDGECNTVGQLECTRYIVLTDPFSGENLAIVEEHWAFAIRSAAATTLGLKWMGPKNPKVVGLIGVGTMCSNALRCLAILFPSIEEVRCTSRSPETREAFADKWSKSLGISVLPMDSMEAVVRDADIGIGGTTSNEIMCREEWVKPGGAYCSFARREFEPEGWVRMDKVIIDSWEMNMLMTHFRSSAETGLFTRDMLHGEIHEVITGAKPGRESDTERNLIHTTGLVAHDIAMCHYIYEQARDKGLGIRLPPSGTGGPSPEPLEHDPAK